MPTIKIVHRSSAVLLGTFIISHIIVHFTALFSAQMHQTALSFIQKVYRNPFAEILLVIIILIQITTGVKRLRFKSIEGWAFIQVVSGCYLACFLVLHTSAALYTHHLFGLETDFYWAAASLQFSPIKYGYALYYFAAIAAFFMHISAAIHFGKHIPNFIIVSLSISGIVISGLIVSAFAGALYSIEISHDVSAYYEEIFSWLNLTRN